jgi:integrase
MPILKRVKTKYPGVTYIIGQSITGRGPEKIFYIRYRRNGKEIEEKAGRQFQDDMTPAKAANLRSLRIEGKDISNAEKRKLEKARKETEQNRWTVYRLWNEYKKARPQIKGIITDENRYENHLAAPFGDKEPNDILPLDIVRVRVKLLKTRKPATVKNVLELLRRIINFGEKKQLCVGLSFKIEMPSVNNQKTEDLTCEQLGDLLIAIGSDSHPQAGALMKMALFTGMRRGELFNLRWEHIDFERGSILIKDPKGGPDQRVPLNDVVKELLRNISKSASPYVFPGRDGARRTDINKAVNSIKNKAGLPKDFRPLHGLRHVYASMLASSGQVDMYTLQKLLTHKSPQMTQRYAHLRDESLKKAADLVGRLLGDVAQSKPENEGSEQRRGLDQK